MNRKYDWIKSTAAILGGLAVIFTLITATLIAPVKECAGEAKNKAEKAAEDIHRLDVRVTKVEDKVDNVDKNLERFMKANGVPPVTEVPAGASPYDTTTTGSK